MLRADCKNFVSVISDEKPVLIFFRHLAQEAVTKKIETILLKIKKELPLLPLYDFIIDDNEENQVLCDFLEVNNAPVLVFYKDGCFSRYKSKMFNDKAIKEFIGGKSTYSAKETSS